MPGLAKYHDELAALMSRHKGEAFSAGTIKYMFRRQYPDLRWDFVQPSDHCIDHICKEACHCAKTEKAIFRRPGYNTYIVL